MTVMPPMSIPFQRYLKTTALTSLSLLTTTPVWTTVFYSAGALSPANQVTAQTLPVFQQPPTSPTPVPDSNQEPGKRPTTLELLEEARQRLRERGELPPLQSNPTTAPGPAPVPASSTDQPFEGRPKTPLDFYRLGQNDRIAITVQRFPDLNFQGTIDVEGNVNIPLLGLVPLEGLTLLQAQEEVRRRLDRYVIDPIVQLTLTGRRPIQVTVVGAVVEPGFFNLGYAPGGSGGGTAANASIYPRVSTALLAAGGTTERADLRAVKIRRTLLDGSFIEQTIDLFTPLKNGDPLPDLNLQDRDAVIVPTLPANETQDYDRALVARSTLSQPVINVRVLSYAGGGIASLRLNNGSTFLDALTQIGPNPDTADLGNIALIRFDPEQGKAVSRQIDGGSVLRGDISQNVPLENNDVIVVGRNLIGEITYALNVFTQPFRDVLGFLLFFDSLSDSATNLFGPTGSSNNRR
jgi:polysaccharide biosynthesis/export protein